MPYPATLAEARKHYYGHTYSRSAKSSNYVEGKCIQQVHGNERWATFTQCRRKATVSGCWCKQHDPAAKKAKDEARRKQWDLQRAVDRLEYFYTRNGEKFYHVIKKIADGHNDARALAQETLDEAGKPPTIKEQR